MVTLLQNNGVNDENIVYRLCLWKTSNTKINLKKGTTTEANVKLTPGHI